MEDLWFTALLDGIMQFARSSCCSKIAGATHAPSAALFEAAKKEGEVVSIRRSISTTRLVAALRQRYPFIKTELCV
jgi:hypothetical protein